METEKIKYICKAVATCGIFMGAGIAVAFGGDKVDVESVFGFSALAAVAIWVWERLFA